MIIALEHADFYMEVIDLAKKRNIKNFIGFASTESIGAPIVIGDTDTALGILWRLVDYAQRNMLAGEPVFPQLRKKSRVKKVKP